MPLHKIPQIDLIAAIARFLEKKCGITHLLTREMNAVIRAADLIVDELAKPESPVVENMGLNTWLQSDATGLSSIFMAATLGGFSRPYAFPRDPSDLGRCLGLIDAVPEFRSRIHEMAATGPEWASLVAVWDELESLYREEKPSGKAPRCYDKMKSVLTPPLTERK